MKQDDYAAKYGEVLWRGTVAAIDGFAQDILEEVAKDGPSVKPELVEWMIVSKPDHHALLVYTYKVGLHELEIEFGIHVIFTRLMSDAMKGAFQIRAALKKLEENGN